MKPITHYFSPVVLRSRDPVQQSVGEAKGSRDPYAMVSRLSLYETKTIMSCFWSLEEQKDSSDTCTIR